MKIRDSVAFITGANRGLGLAFTKELLALGARKVYAGVRDPASIHLPNVTAVRIDVTDAASLRAAAKECRDVSLLVNNAGISLLAPSTLDETLTDTARKVFETNFYGLIHASQAFMPVIASNGGGGMINVLGDATWLVRPMFSAYAASKCAAWSFTNALRHDIRESSIDINVLALHVGFLDTDMMNSRDVKRIDPQLVASRTLAALELGHDEVFGDEHTLKVKLRLSHSRPDYLATRLSEKK